MQAQPSETEELLKTRNRQNQVQCYIVIHTTVTYLIIFSGLILAAGLLAGMYERSIFFAVAFVFCVATMMAMALDDFIASTIWTILMMAYFAINVILLMVDAKHFFGVCNKPYCDGWRQIVFDVFYALVGLNLLPIVVILYFLWRIVILEAEDDKLSMPK